MKWYGIYALLFAALALFAMPAVARPPGESFDRGAISHNYGPAHIAINDVYTLPGRIPLLEFPAIKGSSVNLSVQPNGERSFRAVGGVDVFSSCTKPNGDRIFL